MCVGKIEIVLEIVGESCVWPGCPGFTTTLTTLTSSQEVNAMLYNLTLSDCCQRFDNLIKIIFQSLIGIFRHGRKTSCWGNSGSNICLYHWPAVPQPEKRRQVESYQLHSNKDYRIFKNFSLQCHNLHQNYTFNTGSGTRAGITLEPSVPASSKRLGITWHIAVLCNVSWFLCNISLLSGWWLI